MQSAQDKFFEAVYLNPALTAFKKYGCSYPLFLLAIWDSHIHHGRSDDYWRGAFGSNYVTSIDTEADDIKKFCNYRKQWLNTHTSSNGYKLTNTAYRPEVIANQVMLNNLNLDKDMYIAKQGWTVLAIQEGGRKGR